MARAEWRQGTLLILLILGSLLRRTDAQNGGLTCTNADADRMNCGTMGIGRDECEIERNCCFDDSVLGRIFCFFPDQCEMEFGDRRNCGFEGINRMDCLGRGCCFDDTVSSQIFCFFPTTAPPPPPLPGGCEAARFYDTIKGLVDQWINLFKDPQSFQSVLQNSNLFSISTYCGVYAGGIDLITGCAQEFAGGIAGLSPSLNNSFFTNLNKINDAKGFCGALTSTGGPTCVPAAVPVCSLLAFDLILTFAENGLQPSQLCDTIEMTIRSIPNCITLATGLCTPEQQIGYNGAINFFNTVVDGLGQYCLTGCFELVRFVRDDPNAMCTWNIKDNVPAGANYCEYVAYTVDCFYMLWQSCPILPEEYLQNALSVLEPGLLAAGCTSDIESIIDGFSFNPAFEVPIHPCVRASIVCARELAFGIGVQLTGPFGGYTLDQVDNRLNTILEELKQGNYQSFCGNPSQRVAPGNPITNCIRDLREQCGPGANDLQKRLADTAADWYEEACVPGCTSLGTKLADFTNECELPSWMDLELSDLPLEIFLAVAPNGASQRLCRPIRDFAICVGELIEQCTFLFNRLNDGRNLLVKAVTGGREDLPLTIYICGVALDFPFHPEPNENHPFFDIVRSHSSRNRPPHLLMTVALLLGLISIYCKVAL